MGLRSHGTSWFDIAQVCQNGHVTNWATKDSPEFNKNYCDKCGAPTIVKCPKCTADIKGEYHVPGVAIFSESERPPPAFCDACGNPYPWTELKLEAAREFIQELDDLDESDKNVLSDSLDHLVKDSPKTKVEAFKFKKVASKISKESVNVLKDLVIGIISEAAKKLIWP